MLEVGNVAKGVVEGWRDARAASSKFQHLEFFQPADRVFESWIIGKGGGGGDA